MGRHADRRSRVAIPVVAGGAAAALVGAILSVQGQATAVALKLSDNLVTNSTFEVGTEGWNTQNASAELSLGAGHDSRRAAKVTALVDRTTLLLNDSPNVVGSATGGATYIATAWVRTDSPSLKVSLRFREVAGGVLIAKGQSTLALTDSGWAQIRSEFVAVGAGHQLAVQLISESAAKGSSISVDDVDVREVLSGPSDSPDAEPAESESPKPTPTPTPTPTKPAATATPAPTVTPKPTTSTPAPPAGSTLFGETMWMNSGESWPQTFSRLEGDYGRIDMIRAFFTGLPAGWSSSLLTVGPRPINVSFKATPSDVIAGKHDAALRSWFAAAPTNRQVWWTYYHEPEDNIERGEFTATDYRAAWKRISGIANDVAPSNLKSTLVLMDWSVNSKSGRNWRDYYAGSAYIDVLGWDSYNGGTSTATAYKAPAEVYGRAVAVSKAEGKPFAFPEWGSQLVSGDNGSGRGAWMKASARYMDSVGAEFGTYFDAPVGHEYRLFDQPGKNALRDIMNGAY